MILFRLSEQPFDLPHPLGQLLPEYGIAHLSLHFFKEILVKATQDKALVQRTFRSIGRAGRSL